MPVLSKDTGAGLLFIAVGTLLLWLATRVSFGNVPEIGPGFFPTILAVILILLGILVTIQGLRDSEGIDFSFGTARRLFFVTGSVVAFALLMPLVGLLPATAATVLLCIAAGDRQSFTSVVLLCLAILTGIWLVFIVGLGVPVTLASNPFR